MMRRTVALFGALLLAGCAATKAGDAGDIRYSGFLSDYANLQRTNDTDLAAFRYVKSGLDLSGYSAILLENPEARMTTDAIRSVGEEDMAYVLGAFDEAFRKELSSKFRMVGEPGPGVLRIRTCLTDADSSTGALTPFSRLLPVGVVLSGAKRIATGTAINVGKVTAEMEILDGSTGEQLVAAVDRRIGTGVTRLVLTNWGDVKASFDTWAERTADRLDEMHLPHAR